MLYSYIFVSYDSCNNFQHEMREQDKALFLQLIKLHSTIKEIRTEMKFIEENCDYPFDSFDGAASYWCKLRTCAGLHK